MLHKKRIFLANYIFLPEMPNSCQLWLFFRKFLFINYVILCEVVDGGEGISQTIFCNHNGLGGWGSSCL